VRLYREERGRFDLVIIDMVMPKLGGRDCFLALKQINPNIKAILSSGYGIDGKAQEILDEGVMGFIQKPYRIAHFSQVVKEVMGRSITPPLSTHEF
jgi:DNA-binding NtrC family response regulator